MTNESLADGMTDTQRAIDKQAQDLYFEIVGARDECTVSSERIAAFYEGIKAIAEAITTARIEALREAAGIIAKAEAANRTVINIAHELGHTEIYESLHDVKSALFGARKDIESLITKGTEADSEPSGVSVDPAES